MVPSPASATRTARRAPSARARSTRVAVVGEWGARTPGTFDDVITPGGDDRALATRSAIVKRGTAEHRRRHGRCHRARTTGRVGTPPRGASPVARGQQLGVGAPALVRRERLGGFAGLDGRPAAPRARRRGAPVTQVLPTSVPVPVTKMAVTAVASSSSAIRSRRTWSRVCAADSATRSRRRAGAGPSAVGSRGRGCRGPGAGPPRRARAARRRTRSARSARGAPRGAGRCWRAARRSQVVAVRTAARPPTRRAAAAVSAGVGAVVKMYGPGPVDDQVRQPAGSGDEPAERAEGLRQGADPQDRRVGSGNEVGSEDRVGLVDHEQCTVAGRQLEQAVDVGEVAVHREHGVGDDERHGALGPGGSTRSSERVEVAVRVDGDLGTREPGPVDDRRVVEFVRADQDVLVAERGDHAEVGGEPGGEEDGGLGAASILRARARARWWIGRLPTISRAAPAPAPQRSSASWAAAITAGCWVRPR